MATDLERRRFAALDVFELAALRGAGIGGWVIRRQGEPHPIDGEPLDADAAAAVERSAGPFDVYRVRPVTGS